MLYQMSHCAAFYVYCIYSSGLQKIFSWTQTIQTRIRVHSSYNIIKINYLRTLSGEKKTTKVMTGELRKGDSMTLQNSSFDLPFCNQNVLYLRPTDPGLSVLTKLSNISIRHVFHALILKGPILTAVDDKFCNIFPNFDKIKV